MEVEEAGDAVVGVGDGAAVSGTGPEWEVRSGRSVGSGSPRAGR